MLKDLGLALEPLKFMEFVLAGTTQGALLSRAGACIVNVPAPERYAVHKLVVWAERPPAERVKAAKDLAQAAALAQWHLRNEQAGRFNDAWRDALGRGAGWAKRAGRGLRALLALRPDLETDALWGAKKR